MVRLPREKISFYATVFCGALLLMIPALYNGYPLVNSDDGTYINSGFIPKQPGDRPIIYGLLLNIFSINGVTLWLAAIVQAITVSWLLMKIIQHNIPGLNYRVIILIYTILSLFTSLSWVTSELIPDICTPIAMMTLYLLVLGKENRLNSILLYGIFFTASATHMSHFLIFMGVVFLTFLFKKLFFEKHRLKYINYTLVLLTGLSVGAILINSSVYSNSKHVFLMTSMVDKGILKVYLEDHCDEKNYAICKYKNMNTDPNWFMWNESSPLSLEGGWEATKAEYTMITNDILSTPKYIKLFIMASFRDSWKQLLDFKIGDGNFPFPAGSHVHRAISTYVPRDAKTYEHAWQHQELIVPKLEWPNRIIYIFVILTAGLTAAIIILKRKHLSRELTFFVFCALIFIVINLWDCATFAQVNGRYGCRVMWLVPFIAILCALQLVLSGKKVKNG